MTSPAVELSVVLPALREEENLRGLLPAIQAECAKTGLSFEVIVVGPRRETDGAEVLCAEAGARYVRRSPTDSYGDAVRSGIVAAAGERIVFMDADGSHPPAMISTLVHELRAHDIVIASRYVRGGSTENSWLLVCYSKLLNFFFAKAFAAEVRDLSNGFKAYRSGLLKGIRLEGQGFDVIQEIFLRVRAAQPGLRVKEVPFRFAKRKHGASKRSTVTFILSYLRLLFRARNGRVG